MSNRLPNGSQVDAITRFAPLVQESFDLVRQDVFVTSLGVDFSHFKAMPSPIGKKDRGDLRRSDGVDTITSNGMIYKCCGTFTGTITDNQRSSKRGDSGIVDPSRSRLVLPRFYNDPNNTATSTGNRIYMAPGDRVYISDPQADVMVANYQEMDFEPGVDNVPMFPIIQMELPIIDSQNIEYIQGADYTVTSDGNIRWTASGKNPGIDPSTGKGRLYSIRYLYKAYWYIMELPKEIRITNVTTGGVRSPERMPFYAVIVREYVYHNQNKGDEKNQLKSKTPARVQKAPTVSIDPAKPVINVDMAAIEDDGDQS